MPARSRLQMRQLAAHGVNRLAAKVQVKARVTERLHEAKNRRR
jgi:hypothetical protein